jgi:transcriptional regulator with XRE-family HTH domain
MQDIGTTLREARELLGLTLAEVERATRIRSHHLEAIERGEFEALPSPVQARGFLHNYADFLGLDANAIVLRYVDALQSNRDRSRPAAPLGETPTRPSVRVRPGVRRWLSVDLFVAVVITLAIVAVLVWGVGRVAAALRERTEEAGAAAMLIPTITPTILLSPEMQESPLAPASGPTLTPTPAPPVVIGPTNLVNLHLQVVKSAWMRVIVDGEEQFSGRVSPGEVHDFQGQQVVEIITGNGAALRAFFNGNEHGLLGALNEVVIRTWTLEGMLTPTPTQTPTPTSTPPVTPTLEATPTSTPQQ